MAGRPQISARVTRSEHAEFQRYANSLGLGKAALAHLLLERELHRKALQHATIEPETTDNLYFVAKEDGSREHFFTSNNADHNRMKEVARANRRKPREKSH